MKIVGQLQLFANHAFFRGEGGDLRSEFIVVFLSILIVLKSASSKFL